MTERDMIVIYHIFLGHCARQASHWDLPLESKVTRSRKAEAQQRAPCDFQVTKELLGADKVIQSHGDAVRVLSFSHLVACPVLLWRIQVGNGF